MGRTKPKVPEAYVTGITDGEGCFYVQITKNSAYKSGYKVQLHFHLKLQAIDEDLLWKIQNTLQCGNVYFQKDNRKNHSHCYRYTVSAQSDIFTCIIPFFQRNKLQTTSKSASFTTFCKIAHLVKQGEHKQAKGMKKIIALKKLLNNTDGLA
tara:strand:+ start:544 stop:999 length:456 start_codon:yes stop_codon:yes gene_type:complete